MGAGGALPPLEAMVEAASRYVAEGTIGKGAYGVVWCVRVCLRVCVRRCCHAPLAASARLGATHGRACVLGTRGGRPLRHAAVRRGLWRRHACINGAPVQRGASASALRRAARCRARARSALALRRRARAVPAGRCAYTRRPSPAHMRAPDISRATAAPAPRATRSRASAWPSRRSATRSTCPLRPSGYCERSSCCDTCGIRTSSKSRRASRPPPA
jgi:hypothetical protein